MTNKLDQISGELSDLNNNLQAFLLVFAEIMGKPLESLSSNGDFKFRDKITREVKKND